MKSTTVGFLLQLCGKIPWNLEQYPWSVASAPTFLRPCPSQGPATAHDVPEHLEMVDCHHCLEHELESQNEMVKIKKKKKEEKKNRVHFILTT